jgi:hypothetical protein
MEDLLRSYFGALDEHIPLQGSLELETAATAMEEAHTFIGNREWPGEADRRKNDVLRVLGDAIDKGITDPIQFLRLCNFVRRFIYDYVAKQTRVVGNIIDGLHRLTALESALIGFNDNRLKGSAQLPPSDGCAAGEACRAHDGATIANSGHRCLECGQKIHSALLCGMSLSQIVTTYPHLRHHVLRSSRNDRCIGEDNADEVNGVCFTCIEKMKVGTNGGGGMFADKDGGIHKSVHTETGEPSATVANPSSSVHDRTKRSKEDECLASYCEDDADDKGASSLVSSSYPTQSDNTHDAATASSLGRSETNLSKQAVACVVPSLNVTNPLDAIVRLPTVKLLVEKSSIETPLGQ